MLAQKVQEISTDLVVVEKLTPAAVFAPGGVQDILDRIAREVRSTHTDISTKAGREAVASLAYKVARSKTALDKMGKELGETHYKSWKAITSERARIETELDALRDEVRKPLTDWENAEKDRIAGHEKALIAIEDLARFASPPSLADIGFRLDAFLTLPPRDWQEFAQRAAAVEAATTDALTKMHTEAAKREADAAELARLRAEQIAREQKERDDRIAAEAAERARTEAEAKAAREAEEARQVALRVQEEAERKAQAERDAAAQREREAAEALSRAEREKQEAEERAQRLVAEAEAERVAGHRRALESIRGMVADACSPFNGGDMIQHITKIFDGMPELNRDFEEFRAQADETIAQGRQEIADRLAVVLKEEEERQQKLERERAEQAERDKKAAAEAAERNRLDAVEAERKRVADETARVAADTARREANTKHLAKINNEVLAALVARGVDPEIGKTIIAAIARGEIPHTKISY